MPKPCFFIKTPTNIKMYIQIWSYNIVVNNINNVKILHLIRPNNAFLGTFLWFFFWCINKWRLSSLLVLISILFMFLSESGNLKKNKNKVETKVAFNPLIIGFRWRLAKIVISSVLTSSLFQSILSFFHICHKLKSLKGSCH